MARVLYTNKRGLRDYTVVDKLEVGLVLQGWEVKSIKDGRINMQGSYVYYNDKNQLVLTGVIVPSWSSGKDQTEAEQKRDRLLLAHRRETDKLVGLAKRPGYTLLPSELYVNDRGMIKLQLVVVKGKKKHEKRQKIKERDIERQMQRELKGKSF
jgi:SsrA-binding protein